MFSITKLLALTVAVFEPELSAQKAEKSNIILIMADDIGLGDFGVYHTLRTGEKPVIRAGYNKMGGKAISR